jgi:dimethylhistidine N-methyltransferase
MSGASRLASTRGELAAAEAASRFAADVQYYLTQDPRQLPSRYLYDALGSALFEAICQLPWYRVTRAELRLLTKHAPDILRRAGPVSAIVELGPGNGEKLGLLLNARGADSRSTTVHLVDISPAALAAAATRLGHQEGVQLRTHQATYEEGLRAATTRDEKAPSTLVLLLGSNVGNYDPPGAAAFLRNIRALVRNGESLLIGADLVKSERDLILAYDDPLGVTAAFNKNLLVRINRELGGNFDLDRFAHRAVWNGEEGRVEMHLVSRSVQRVAIDQVGISFEMRAEEIIWTESSYKYRPESIAALLESAGFRCAAQWIDKDDGFALTLASAV